MAISSLKTRLLHFVRNDICQGNLRYSIVMELNQFLNKKFFWYADISKINLSNVSDKRWVLSKVLRYGTIADIKKLDYNEIKKELNNLLLPDVIRKLWEDFFSIYGDIK